MGQLGYLQRSPKPIAIGNALVNPRPADSIQLASAEPGAIQETEEFRRFVSAFERVTPLHKPSNLAQREVVQYLLAASAGLTGDIARLLFGAAELAIRDRSEQISLRHIEHVASVPA